MRWLVLVVIAALGSAAHALADDPLTGQSSEIPLYLDVVVNGQPSGLIAEFYLDADGRFRSKASELIEIGIEPGVEAVADAWVYLDHLPGIAFLYNESEQRVFFTFDPSRTVQRVYGVRGVPEHVRVTRPDVGVGANYSFSGQLSAETFNWLPQIGDLLGGLDVWLFSPYGTFSQSGYVKIDGSDWDFDFRRLDTKWSRSDPDKQLTYNAGDFISGGLGWSRPIRMAGVQIRRNFATRPDLITRPLPSVDGTAAVPSTIDIFLGDVPLSTIDVETGRFLLSDIPTPSENGELRVVLRDATGLLTEQVVPFGASRSLLRKGLLDFSLDVGTARTGFATDSDAYDGSPIAVGSLRYGLNDRVTLEGHSEIGAGLVNLGAGLALDLSRMGGIEVAVAGSTHDGDSGALVSVDYEKFGEFFSFRAAARRIFGDYADLADVTAPTESGVDLLAGTSSYEWIQATTRLWDDASSLSANYIHSESRSGDHRHILGASYGRRLSEKSHLFLSGQAELGSDPDATIQAGLSFTLGGDKSGYAGVTYSKDHSFVQATVSKSMTQKPGSWGYGASLQKNDTTTQGAFSASRFGERSLTTAIVGASENDVGVYGSIEGGAALIGGDVFLSRRIDDAFAIVDAGAPGVTVYHENHEIGATGKNGKLLVPDIRSFEANKLSIEPNDLPLSSNIIETSKLVSLPDRTGLVIDFAGIDHPGEAAIVILTDSNGEFLPLGSVARLQGSSDETIVGYDGEAFFMTLGRDNVVEVNTGESICSASFAFHSDGSPQPRLGPIECG